MSDNSRKCAAMQLTSRSARYLDAVRLKRSAAGRINTLRLEWLAAQD
jgi:hypothetical protein